MLEFYEMFESTRTYESPIHIVLKKRHHFLIFQ